MLLRFYLTIVTYAIYILENNKGKKKERLFRNLNTPGDTVGMLISLTLRQNNFRFWQGVFIAG